MKHLSTFIICAYFACDGKKKTSSECCAVNRPFSYRLFAKFCFTIKRHKHCYLLRMTINCRIFNRVNRNSIRLVNQLIVSNLLHIYLLASSIEKPIYCRRQKFLKHNTKTLLCVQKNSI